MARALRSAAAMTQSDRAFHALAQNEPHVVFAALRAICPEVVAGATPVRVEDLLPTRLDALAPPLDADWLACVGARTLLHLECQGYRDAGFPRRLFRYHLLLTLRYPERVVRTVALWLTKPPGSQRRGRITRGDVTVRTTHVLLAEVPAATLLADPRTVCFAPGGDAGELSEEALCDAVARALVEADASWYQRLMAVTTAHTRGRDEAMTRALSKAGSPPIIIEDIFFMGEDKGILKTSVRSVLAVAEARGFKLTKAQRERVEKCKDLPKLDRWLKQAATAAKATDIFTAPATIPRRRKAEAM